jgi:NAD+ synthase
MKRKEVIEHIVGWLKSYSEKSNTAGFVIGISGGIDSAVTSTLCAMTGKRVICLNMPIHQNKSEFDRGQEHITWLQSKFPNVSTYITDLTSTFEAMSAAFPQAIQDRLTMANTRARLRMTTLYAFACHHKMLVAGTGNKVEDFGIGFFTKYGDGGVDLSPIADLMKSEVFSLANELDIVLSVQSAKPTDGLFEDGRTDEDQIGASYDELEWAMTFIENGGDASTLSGRQKHAFETYTRMHTANLHKMVPIPVCEIPKELK